MKLHHSLVSIAAASFGVVLAEGLLNNALARKTPRTPVTPANDYAVMQKLRKEIRATVMTATNEALSEFFATASLTPAPTTSPKLSTLKVALTGNAKALRSLKADHSYCDTALELLKGVLDIFNSFDWDKHPDVKITYVSRLSMLSARIEAYNNNPCYNYPLTSAHASELHCIADELNVFANEL